MAGQEPHAIKLDDVPRAYDEPARGRVRLDLGGHVADLIDTAAPGRGGLTVVSGQSSSGGGGRPGAPLPAVDGAEVAVFIGPLIPDGDAVLLEVGDAGVASQEPEEFVDDGAQVELLGGQAGEARGEIEAHLVAEDAFRAGPGAIVLAHTIVTNVPKKIEIRDTPPEPPGVDE